MPEVIAESDEPGSVLGDRRRSDTADFEPAEIYRENLDRERGKEERGERYAYHRENRDGIVHHAILIDGGFDSERNRDEKLQNSCDKGYRERYSHILSYNVLNGAFILERHSEVAF